MNVNKTAPHLFLLYFAVVTSVFLAIILLTEISTSDVDSVEQLSEINLEEEVALLSINCYERYPGALYTPEDFAEGRVTQEPSAEHPTMERGFGTYRIVLRLPPGEIYGLSAYTATFAQKLWIDGKPVSQMGDPGESFDTTVPKTGYFTVYFEADSESEIILQRSDFVHANGGQVYPIYLGRQDKVSALANGIILRGVFVAGCSMMAALFFFGIYLFFKHWQHLLWFSMACLSITVYTLIIDHKLIMLLFPNLPWYASHRIEYITGAGVIFFFFLYVVRMFDLRVRQSVNIFGIGVLAVYTLSVLLAPSPIYTALMPYLRAGGTAYCLGAIVVLGRSITKLRKNRHAEHYLIFIGTIIYVVLTIAGIPLHSTGRYGDSNLFRIGMLQLVFVNTLALSLSFTRTEAALDEARQKQRELDESNYLLDSLNEMKTRFIANISHEMKTPLTVMSVNAQVSKAMLRIDGDKDEINRNLDAITDETRRMARMVSEVLDLSNIQEGRGDFDPLDLGALLAKTAEVYRTMLEKCGNSIMLSIPDDLPLITGSADMLVQVVVNLLANANAHTYGGMIVLSAAAEKNTITVCVNDNGEGIAKDTLPYVFTRRHTSRESGGTGLGLSICKDIIKRHGGEINIISTQGVGTTVIFDLPILRKGDVEDE